jgi:HK97 family phage portal protein
MRNEKVSLKDRINAFRNPHTRDTSSLLKGNLAGLMGGSESGVNVTEETALAFSAVWQAMRIWSELPPSLPIEFYEEKKGYRTQIEHDAQEVLLNPNGLMNRFTWNELMSAWLHGWGNGVSIINRSGGAKPIALMPVHPSAVTAKLLDGRMFYDINDRELGIKGTFFSEEVIHYKGFTTTGLWGKSPIQVAKDNIGLGLAAEKFGAKYFRKGGNLKQVIETEGHMSDPEFLAWKKRWQENYTGIDGDHETPILEYGMKLKPLTIAPDAAQFLQTRQFSIQDVARWFNLPVHMLNDLSRSTFSNIEHQDLQLIKYSFRATLKRMETELEDKLLLPKEKNVIKIRYNLDALLRGDLASVTQHIKEMVQIGVMSPNEGRALINKNPRPGGDEFYTPANIVGNENAGKAGKTITS